MKHNFWGEGSVIIVIYLYVCIRNPCMTNITQVEEDDDQDHDQDVQNQQQQLQNLLAGFIRAVTKPFRGLLKTKRLHIGHKRALAKGVDHLSTVLDVSKEVQKVKGSGSDTDQPPLNSGDNRIQRAKLQTRRILLAAPGFVKSTSLGTLSFSVYETIANYSQQYLSFHQTQASALGGFCAGLANGFLFHLWLAFAYRRYTYSSKRETSHSS